MVDPSYPPFLKILTLFPRQLTSSAHPKETSLDVLCTLDFCFRQSFNALGVNQGRHILKFLGNTIKALAKWG